MGTYDRQIASAVRMIAKYGQLITWKSLTNGVPTDPNKPWLPSAGTPVEHTLIPIVFLPHTKDNLQLIRYIKGSDVTTGSLTGLMAQVAFEPKAKDVVVRDEIELVISTIDILAPNGTPILYSLEFEQ